MSFKLHIRSFAAVAALLAIAGTDLCADPNYDAAPPLQNTIPRTYEAAPLQAHSNTTGTNTQNPNGTDAPIPPIPNPTPTDEQGIGGGGNPDGFGGNDQGGNGGSGGGGGPPFPMLPMGFGGGGGGMGGGGQTPQPPQMANAPQAQPFTLPTPPAEPNLSAALAGATSQLANAMDGSRLTAITDAIGKDMENFQKTLFSIIQTSAAREVQALKNRVRSAYAYNQNMPTNPYAQSYFAPRRSNSTLVQFGGALNTRGAPPSNIGNSYPYNVPSPRTGVPSSSTTAQTFTPSTSTASMSTAGSSGTRGPLTFPTGSSSTTQNSTVANASGSTTSSTYSSPYTDGQRGRLFTAPTHQ